MENSMDGDEIIDPGTGADSGTPEPITPAVDPAAVQPDPAAASGTPDPVDGDAPDADPYADLYEKLDEPGEVQEQPTVAGNLPPELTTASQESEFFKNASDLPVAIQLADQLQGVRTGKTHAGDFIDELRAENPERHAKVLDEMVEYLTALGKIAPQGEQKPVDPEMAAMRAELQKVQQAEQARVEERAKQEFEVQRQDTAKRYTEHLTSLTKGTWLEGTEADFGNRVLSQLDKMGVKPQDFAAAMKKGDTSQIDRAVKAAKNEVLDLVKMYNKNLLDKKSSFRRNTPAAPGQGGGPIKPSANGLPQRNQFPAGDEGDQKFYAAMADAAFAK